MLVLASLINNMPSLDGFFRTFLMVLGLMVSLSMPGAAQDVDVPAAGPSADDLAVADALDAIRNGEFQKGTAILQRLAEQANPDALFHLAEMARLGIGGEVSMPIAIMYYRLAGKLGNEKAAMKLANILYFDGGKTAAEIAEALSIWQTYALQGNPEAAYLLGIIYWNGENGRTPDPLRGYGLVWRAAKENYQLAVESELEMRSLLEGDARRAGQAYGERLEELGFNDDLIGMDLLVEGWTPDEEETTIQKPDDWKNVWHLEVGFALREADAAALLEEIRTEHAALVEGLFSEMAPSPNRIDRYKLIFGPLDGLNSAVSLCVSLKRAGFDCFAKPPE